MRAISGVLTSLFMCAVAIGAERAPPIDKASAAPVTSIASAQTNSAQAKGNQAAATKLASVSFKAEHPGDTALSQDEHGTWQLRSFPGLATLYVYDKDTAGTSNCGAPCASAWSPLFASRVENEPVGDWTLIARSDGRRQWAYKGQPVYLRYHDLPASKGNVQSEGFRQLVP